jgi:type III restriction enzyme
LYEGAFQFQKHFYGAKPGELRDGEEGDCAKFIDGLREVKFWVRNLSRKPGSFRFQTSTDSFYPDFVCQLIDGRVLVVEYKGQHLFDTPDAEEKRLVGQAWESLSTGKCLFLMLTKRNFAAISAKIGDIAHADDFRLS